MRKGPKKVLSWRWMAVVTTAETRFLLLSFSDWLVCLHYYSYQYLSQERPGSDEVITRTTSSFPNKTLLPRQSARQHNYLSAREGKPAFYTSTTSFSTNSFLNPSSWKHLSWSTQPAIQIALYLQYLYRFLRNHYYTSARWFSTQYVLLHPSLARSLREPLYYRQRRGNTQLRKTSPYD